VSPEEVGNAPAKPLISVCVPMYNNSTTIERCLRSVLDQDGVEFEIVVVDDESTDNGAAIVEAMLRAGDRLARNDSRLGLNENHNKCLELARGAYIQFVHGDDWLLPGALKTLGRCFDDPAVGLAFAPRRVLNDNVPPGFRKRTPEKLHIYFWKLEEYNHGPFLVAQVVGLLGASANFIGEPTSVMFRRQLALDAGGLRDDVYQAVDLDFWLRLMLRCAVCFVPQELSVRHHTAGTETSRIIQNRQHWLDQLRILTWMIVDPSSTTVIRSVARVWWPVAWLTLLVGAAVSRRERRSRLKTLLMAPVREFARARQFRDGLLPASM
ncbi:Glycosyltransferase, GT2 family, partial [Mycobacterium rhizamassiliense]